MKTPSSTKANNPKIALNDRINDMHQINTELYSNYQNKMSWDTLKSHMLNWRQPFFPDVEPNANHSENVLFSSSLKSTALNPWQILTHFHFGLINKWKEKSTFSHCLGLFKLIFIEFFFSMDSRDYENFHNFGQMDHDSDRS